MVSLLCGSDYLDNIKGLGLIVILSFFDDDYNEMLKLDNYFIHSPLGFSSPALRRGLALLFLAIYKRFDILCLDILHPMTRTRCSCPQI